MKKLLTIILVLALILPAAAISEDVFDKLTFEELLAINQVVQLKLFEKGALVNGVTIPGGIYRIGEDIPVGYYRIVYTPPYETACCTFNLQESNGGTYFVQLGFTGSYEIGKIYLDKDANIWTDADLTFYTYTGVFK